MNQKTIDIFLQRSSLLPKIIVIYGPTACGKTKMSIEIAQYLKTKIISTDSKQIFREMDIGTGKITQDEMQAVEHFMIDIIDPSQNYSVADFKSQAKQHIQEIYADGKIPLLVGGTGLYIDALIYENQIGHMPSDAKLRKTIESLSQDALYAQLQEIDPEYARELHPNNRPYLERAFEIKLLTGRSKKDFRTEKKLKYEVLFLTPYDGNREKLYTRINTRVEEMFSLGLEQEIQGLLEAGYTLEDFGLKNTIGYKEFIPYILGEISLQELKQLIQQHSRNYAKRQLTWFSKYIKNRSES